MGSGRTWRGKKHARIMPAGSIIKNQKSDCASGIVHPSLATYRTDRIIPLLLNGQAWTRRGARGPGERGSGWRSRAEEP